MAFDVLTCVHRALYTVVLSISFGSCCYVASRCFLRMSLQKLFTQQLLAFSLTEMAYIVWRYVPSCIYYRTIFYPGDPPWCTLHKGVQRWLQLLSVLFSALLALGLLSALLRRKRFLRSLRWGPFLVVPLSLLMNVAYFVLPEIFHPKTENIILPYCPSTRPSQTIFGAELALVFLGVVCTHAYSLCRLHKAAPASVMARSVHNGSKYLCAFTCSWMLYIFSQVYELLAGEVIDMEFWYIHLARDLLYNCHGLFNLIAFRSHMASQPDQMTVLFRSNPSLITLSTAHVSEVSECDDSWSLYGIVPLESPLASATPSRLTQSSAAMTMVSGSS
eukprot:TRINITY_DN41618_c0_g1_i1.p1 TRINITY_DN41618_c0_g1~~TRINITY_DN41618_c0_g1_i1.p1  ORF type:complete len:332 (+),score=27.90 TRINITY_DN41618_c0_g1_i1:23-1018(+)